MSTGSKARHVLCTQAFHTSAVCQNKEDFYQVLGVARNATQKEIKKSYYQVSLTIWSQGTNQGVLQEPGSVNIDAVVNHQGEEPFESSFC